MEIISHFEEFLGLLDLALFSFHSRKGLTNMFQYSKWLNTIIAFCYKKLSLMSQHVQSRPVCS